MLENISIDHIPENERIARVFGIKLEDMTKEDLIKSIIFLGYESNIRLKSAESSLNFMKEIATRRRANTDWV